MSEYLSDRPLVAIAISGVLTSISSAVAYLLKFLSRVLLARVLGPTGFGQFSIGLAVYGMLTLFAGAGIPAAVVKIISSETSKGLRRRWATIALLSITLLSLVATLFAFALRSTFSSVFNVPSSVLTPFILVVLFDLVFSTLRGIALGYGDIWIRVWLTDVGLALGYVFFVVGGALLFGSPAAASAGFFVSVVILSFLALAYCARKQYFAASGISLRDVRRFILYSIPFLVISISSLVFLWSDTLVLGAYLGPLDVGIYRAATTLVYLITFVFSAITVLFLPVVSRQISQGNYVLATKTYSFMARWISFAIAPLSVILVSFGRQALFYVFGAEYLGAYPALVVLSLSWFFVYLFSLSGQVLIARGEECLVSRVLLFAAVFNVVLDVMLVPFFGLTGAAVATSLSLLLSNAYFFVRLWRFGYRVSLRRVFLTITVAALSAIPVFLVSRVISGILAVLVGLFVYGITYVLLSLATSLLRLDDVRKLLEIVLTGG